MAVNSVENNMGLPKVEAFFKNEEELEVIYPTEFKSTKDKKKKKEIILTENPEILLSDYSGPEDNRQRQSGVTCSSSLNTHQSGTPSSALP